MNNSNTFNHILGNNLIVFTANSLIWFSLTFWVFLNTHSVLATAYVGGFFALSNLLLNYFFGILVDRYHKKSLMMYSSLGSLLCYSIGLAALLYGPTIAFERVDSPLLWFVIFILILGSTIGSLRIIALSTTVTILFKDDKDKANGKVGAIHGASFALASLVSGFIMGWFGIIWCVLIAIFLTIAGLIHVKFIELQESLQPEINKTSSRIKETLLYIITKRGLLWLIIFTTFNNLLSGTFTGLMDAYGLSLMSVELWGTIFAVTSLSFIVGSSIIAIYGLGKNPLKTMLWANIGLWFAAIIFAAYPSITLIIIGSVMWMALYPVIEATEQTVIQTIIPLERQGRVFGLAQSIEQAAAPIMTFIVGPLATYITIPWLTDGAGVHLIGSWFGTGMDRGIALIFITAGIIGLSISAAAFLTRPYRLLSKQFTRDSPSN